MKYKAWWHRTIHGHRQVEKHYSVPEWASDEGIGVRCSCGERFYW